MKPYRILLPLLFIAALASCEKVLDFDTETERTLVVNGMPSAQKQLFVNLSYSHLFLDANMQHPLTPEDIYIEVNGNRLTPSSTEGCNIFFNYIAQEDDTLAFHMTADGETVEARTYVPKMPVISNMKSQFDSSLTFNLGLITFDLDDHADIKEYYHINIVERDSGVRYNPRYERYDTIDTIFHTYFLVLSPELNEGALSLENLASRILTTDKNIDGKRCNISLALLMLIDTNEVAPFAHQYTLNIESITYDRYLYLKDIGRSTNSTTSFSEPFSIYTNIKGKAVGIFAGNASKQYHFTFDRPPAPTSHQHLKHLIKKNIESYRHTIQKK